ncbi:MAG TPA: hypothetical protein VF039_13475 [Longimicrobiales bacterium]
MADTSGAAVWSPPYVAWRNLLSLIERLESNTPPQIDRTFLTGSNASRTLTLHALRSLELIDGQGGLTDRLTDLVDAGEDRPQAVAKMLKHFYAKPLLLADVNATQKQLEDAFEEWGVQGDTKRKAIAFFLKAAAYAKLPMSKNFKTPASGGRKAGKARARSEAGGAAGAQRHPNSDPPMAPETALRARYIEMLMKKADSQEQLDADLLDRIEKLLGVSDTEVGEQE